MASSDRNIMRNHSENTLGLIVHDPLPCGFLKDLVGERAAVAQFGREMTGSQIDTCVPSAQSTAPTTGRQPFAGFNLNHSRRRDHIHASDSSRVRRAQGVNPLDTRTNERGH